MLGKDQYCSHVINIRWDAFNQIRRNKAIVDKRGSLGVPPQVTIGHPYIGIGTRAWRNGEDIRSARLLVLCHPKRNALA